MKKSFFLLLSLILFPVASYFSVAYAHGTGLPPFFKINGVLAPANPFQIAAVNPTAFQVPQDISPANYLKDQPIDFEIDTTSLEGTLPKEIVDKISFSWDFGDGTKGDGVKNSHSYNKPGSFILAITADYHQADLQVPQLIETVQINVLPSKDYKMPEAVIKINNKQSRQSVVSTLDTDLNKRLTFDARGSTALSSKIVSYTWDFDDSQTSNQPLTSHRYKLPLFYVSPSLMVRDENGLVSFAFINISNSGQNNPNNPQLEDIKDTIFRVAPWAIGGLVVLIIGLILFIKRRKKVDEKQS